MKRLPASQAFALVLLALGFSLALDGIKPRPAEAMPLMNRYVSDFVLGQVSVPRNSNCSSATASCVGTTFTGTGAGQFSSLKTTGPVVGSTGDVNIGARASSYTALWFSVTPGASNYTIGGGPNGDTDINATSGQNISFNVNNSNVGFINSTGLKLAAGLTRSRGTITLSTGTGTATVNSGAVCVCSSTTANAAYCSVSSTTLTATGTGTDVVSYICL